MKNHFSILFCSLSVTLFACVFAVGGLSAGQALPSDAGAKIAAPVETRTAPKADSSEEDSVRKVADQLYKELFIDDGYMSPKFEKIKHCFENEIFALITREYARTLGDDDDGYIYNFVPGNGGAETYALQPAEIKGSVATVSVIFDGRDGSDGQDPAKILLHFKRQADGQWLIADICDVCDGTISPWSSQQGNASEVSKKIENTNNTEKNLVMGKVMVNSGVILRKSANRKAKELGKIPTGTDLDILSMDGPEETIEGKTGKWFSVRWNSPAGKVEGWVFGGFIEISQGKEGTAKAPAIDKSQWVGQNTASAAAEMGLEISQSRDVSDDGTYMLDSYRAGEKSSTVFFTKSSGKASDGSDISNKILDFVVLPQLSEIQFYSNEGELNGKRDDQLFGIGIQDETEALFKKSAKVWRANPQTEKIEEVSAEGVKFAINTEEGYIPE